MKYAYHNVLFITDNKYLAKRVMAILQRLNLPKKIHFTFAASTNMEDGNDQMDDSPEYPTVNVKKNMSQIIGKFDLIFSLHCKQIFPHELVAKVKCINIHPGFNPFNRGWYPQVFSIINKLPIGVTIHEMDDQLDHGPIIAQEKMQVYSYDTSETVYERLIELELKLFEGHVQNILRGTYKTFAPSQEGNVNLKKDFERLKRIELGKSYTGREMIDLLRALTHGDYRNSYFIDDSDNKIFIKIVLSRDV